MENGTGAVNTQIRKRGEPKFRNSVSYSEGETKQRGKSSHTAQSSAVQRASPEPCRAAAAGSGASHHRGLRVEEHGVQQARGGALEKGPSSSLT